MSLPEWGQPANVTTLDPDRYFGKTGLQHATLRQAVLAPGPIAVGIGRTLWWYDTGVWRSNGEDEVRRRTRQLLGERWRKTHAEGIVSDLLADHTFIGDRPPAQWVNCRNGLLDWKTGTLTEHRQNIPTTYQVSTEWNPTATCPTVDAWLDLVAPTDAINLVWEIIGTAIYAGDPFHRAVILVGPGRNGKGTLLRLIQALIGVDHVAGVTLQALGENRFAAAELFGKVANIAGDLDARSIARTDVFKMATGGDPIHAERKYGQPFVFTNRATMLFSANELPGTADMSEGFFRRWCVVPFTELQLAPGEEDHSIERKLHAEMAGVLVKAVEGLRRAMARGGYDNPPSVQAATAEYREHADPLRLFSADELEVTGNLDDDLPRSAVYARYRHWCELNGHRPMSARRFWDRLRSLHPDLDLDGARVVHGQRHVAGLNFLVEGDAGGSVPDDPGELF